jgi:hypothetical protein
MRVLQRPAVLIGAGVDRRVPELLDQMREGRDLHAVPAATVQAQRDVDEPLHQRAQFLHLER